MINLSFLSFLPFIGHRFVKSTYVLYVKDHEYSDLQKPTSSINNDNFEKYEEDLCLCCFSICNKNELFQCSLSNLSETNGDKHVFCKKCIETYVKIGISDSQVKISCMCKNQSEICKGIFSDEVLLKCIEYDVFLKLKDLMEVNEIKKFHKNLQNYHICPFCNKCGIVSQKKILKCKHEKCRKKWCSKCKKPPHSNNSCKKIIDKNDRNEIRKIVEDTINNSLIKKCPRCKSVYVKEEGKGCNHMTCTICGTRSCYVCQKENCGKCKLFNHNDRNNIDDNGNWLFNRKKIINNCKHLILENEKEVQYIISKELENHGIYINPDDIN